MISSKLFAVMLCFQNPDTNTDITNTYQIFIILPQLELAWTEQLFTTIIKYCNFVHGVHCSLILIHSQKLKHVMTPRPLMLV